MDKKLVLFVDDELNPKKNVSKKNRETLYQMVKALEGFCEVVQVYSMNSALEKIKFHRFDAAVVDILISISDEEIYSRGKKDYGNQLIKELIENNIPVLSITNRADRYTSSILGSEYGVATLDKKLSEIPRLISLVEELKPNRRRRYCSFHPENNEICQEEFEPKGQGSIFVISSNEYKEDAQEFSDRLRLMKYQVDCWLKNQDEFAGGIFCDKTCPRIYGNKILAADISDLNCNVFFEIGFAFGIGRPVFLMFKNDKEKPGLKILKTILLKGYKQIEELLESFESTIETNKKLLHSNKIYATPDMFKNIHEFDKPEKREKEGKYLASYDNSLITRHQEIFRDNGIVSDIIPFNLSKNSKNTVLVAKKLIYAKSVLFFPQGDMKSSLSDYRINNAELMFFAGLCVAQGAPVRIITDSDSPDFLEISISPSNLEAIKDFILGN